MAPTDAPLAGKRTLRELARRPDSALWYWRKRRDRPIRLVMVCDVSGIGGFFKEFELSVIAADERDIVQVRTNVRDERDYLYRIRLPMLEMRSLFLAYIGEANRLVHHPRFYNTVTANCTTLVYHMLKRIVGHLPVDYRVLFSGYLPEYVYSVGGLDKRYPLEVLRSLGFLSERAKKANGSADFSALIRQGVPSLN